MNSLLAGLLPVPSSSSARAFLALGVISLFFLLIVSSPDGSAPDTLRILDADADDSPIRPGLEVSERLCGNDSDDEGPAMLVNDASGKLSSGCRGRRDIEVIVARCCM